MKRIGIIGGVSWESTAIYYRIINESVQEILGGNHSAKVIVDSVDFSEVDQKLRAGEITAAEMILVESAQRLERAGAEALAIASNTGHRAYERIQDSVNVPVLHIVDAVFWHWSGKIPERVGLLGTKLTLMGDHLKEPLLAGGVREILIPPAPERIELDRIIFDELACGRVVEESRSLVYRLIDGLLREGAECVVLGCTELCLLVRPEETSLPVVDTTELHAKDLVRFMLGTD